MRIVVIGGPKSGKTTAYPDARHTDDLMDLGWSEASAEVAEWMAEPGPWTIEGVAAVRGLRKALRASKDKPCDTVVYMHPLPSQELTAGQERMCKGVNTIFLGICSELQVRGVTIQGATK